MDRYPDGDVAVQILDSVRRREVFLIPPTSPRQRSPGRASYSRRCLPPRQRRAHYCDRAFFGYGRADKRHGRREPIMARVVANLLEVVGISHIVTVDLHTPQIEGFVHAPVHSLTAGTNALPSFARPC